MKLAVFDLEANHLIFPTKIHCLTAAVKSSDGSWNLKSTADYDTERKFFLNADVLLGHNIHLYDIPVVERLLGIKIKAKLIDTLPISWYLYPDRKKHGLEFWGEDFGIPKPKIDDWVTLPVEVYINRCEEDVKITTKLWDKQFADLLELYETEEKVYEFLEYLMFKMKCARLQEKSRWKLDVEKCESMIKELGAAKEVKTVELAEVMPKIPIKAYKTRPKKMHKADNTLSALGAKWEELCESLGLPVEWEEPIEYVRGYKEPNPGSSPQVKAWLYSFGWKPENFEYKREDDGSTRKIEQIRVKKDGIKTLCPSVVELYSKEPKLEILEGITVLTHRIGVFKGFLRNRDEEDFLQAQIAGLTNTLRFKHKTIVNLPGVDKAYGKDIRGALIAKDEDHELCGADMAALEDKTKLHYMWDYDPDYVTEMNTPGYDAHLSIGVFANLISEEDSDFFKGYKKGKEEETPENYERYKRIGGVRQKAKAVNYSSVYGVGVSTLARNMKVPEKEAALLLSSYWKKNWSVKELAKDLTVKSCLDKKWLFNPISKFWYSLRGEKDRFSTLNQGKINCPSC